MTKNRNWTLALTIITLAASAACSSRTPEEHINDLITQFEETFSTTGVEEIEKTAAHARRLREQPNMDCGEWQRPLSSRYGPANRVLRAIERPLLDAFTECQKTMAEFLPGVDALTDLARVSTAENARARAAELRMFFAEMSMTALEIIFQNESDEAAWAMLMKAMGHEALGRMLTPEQIIDDQEKVRAAMEELFARAAAGTAEAEAARTRLQPILDELEAGSWTPITMDEVPALHEALGFTTN